MIPIKVTLIKNRGYVFSATDYINLREQQRICGNLVGCVISCPRNSNVNGLPAVLNKIELQLLLEMKIIELIDKQGLFVEPSSDLIDEYANFRKISFTEQHEQQRLAKLDESRKIIGKILDGKKKKLIRSGIKENEIILTEKLVLDDIYATCSFNTQNFLLQIPSEYPHELNALISATLYETEENNSLQSRVFLDLWKRGYYVTSGHSFGGDFLVYLGDPMSFHAAHIIHCIPRKSGSMSAAQLISYGRLSVVVKKLCVFVYVTGQTGQFEYETMNWEGNARYE